MSQATDEDWREYAFKAKPGDPKRLPRQVAPYHLRLDWLMWFIPISPAYAGDWFVTFLYRLLEADRPTLRLHRTRSLRRRTADAGSARGSSTTATRRYRELRETGAWWVRKPVGELVPQMRLR